jgi:hypothetical protein
MQSLLHRIFRLFRLFVCSAVALVFQLNAGINVGLIPTTDAEFDNGRLQESLQNLGIFGSVVKLTGLDKLTGPEIQATLANYDVLFLYASQADDLSAVGNEIATYVDGGGKLVAATYF